MIQFDTTALVKSATMSSWDYNTAVLRGLNKNKIIGRSGSNDLEERVWMLHLWCCITRTTRTWQHVWGTRERNNTWSLIVILIDTADECEGTKGPACVLNFIIKLWKMLHWPLVVAELQTWRGKAISLHCSFLFKKQIICVCVSVIDW